MADDVKALSSQLAQDPDSLVFLRLGELLRQRRQLDAAHRVALTGLERHPTSRTRTICMPASSPTSATTSARSTSGTWRGASRRTTWGR